MFKLNSVFFVSVLSAFFISFIGYIEVFFESDDSRLLRASNVSLVFIASLGIFFLNRKEMKEIGFFHVFLFVFILYGFSVSFVKGVAYDSLSMLLRLFSFIVISVVSYNLCNKSYNFELYCKYFFVACSFFCFIQTLYDVNFDGGIFMNGAIRYYGSVGSPIGFSAMALSILIGVSYYWVKSNNLIFLLSALALLWVILMTATRSSSIAAFFVFFVTVYVSIKDIKCRAAWLFIYPLLCYFLYYYISTSSSGLSGVVERASSTLVQGEVDNSLSFRFQILNTYIENINISEFLFGLGLGAFPSWFYNASGVIGVAPHFEVLWIISEFGFLLFLMLFIVFVLYFRRVFILFFSERGRPEELFSFSMFLVAQQVFLQLANPFYFYQFVVVFGIFSGVALAKFDLFSFNLRKFF